jgi:hypothetical protein
LLSFLAALTAAAASANVDMSKYNGKVLYVNGNGYTGKTAGLTFTKQNDGSYIFNTVIQFTGEPSDKVTGKVIDRHFTFTRTRADKLNIQFDKYSKPVITIVEKGFVQKYDGWLFQKSSCDNWMSGTFIRKELDAIYDTFRSFEHYDENYELYCRTVRTTWNYTQEHPYKGELFRNHIAFTFTITTTSKKQPRMRDLLTDD